MNTKIVKFTKHILDVMFVSGIIVILTLPISLRYLAKFKIEVFMNQYIPMLIIFGILWIIKLFFNPTPAALVIIIVFFIAALFSQVLACVFNQAIAYKEENDFTI